MEDLHVQTTKKRKKCATLTAVSLSAITWPPFASQIRSLVATAPASKAPPSPITRTRPGFAGPGSHCGEDGDADGWADEALACSDENCAADNCRDVPNSGQEDSDGDGVATKI